VRSQEDIQVPQKRNMGGAATSSILNRGVSRIRAIVAEPVLRVLDLVKVDRWLSSRDRTPLLR